MFIRLATGLVVMGQVSCSEGRGIESRHLILDGHFFTDICCKIVLVTGTDPRNVMTRKLPIL